jgi:hypothetical protein
MFRKKKSTWSKVSAPVVKATASRPVRSGATAMATFVGMTVASAAVSAARRRRDAS